MDPYTISHGTSNSARPFLAINALNFDATTSEKTENLAVFLTIILELKFSALLILLGLGLLSILSSFTASSWHLSLSFCLVKVNVLVSVCLEETSLLLFSSEI